MLLSQYRTASGYGYKNTILDLRGKGKEATLTRSTDGKTFQLTEKDIKQYRMWMNSTFINRRISLILIGANGLTDGAASVAKRFRISDLVIGLTL